MNIPDRISFESSLGQALLGLHAEDTAKFTVKDSLPKKEYQQKVKIVSILPGQFKASTP